VLDDLWMFSENEDVLYIVAIDDLYDNLAGRVSSCAVFLLISQVSHSLARHSHPFLVGGPGKSTNW
jgi:hypothetical protein